VNKLNYLFENSIPFQKKNGKKKSAKMKNFLFFSWSKKRKIVEKRLIFLDGISVR